MKVAILLHKNDMSKDIGPGTRTYAGELIKKLSREVELKLVPYTSIMTSFMKPGSGNLFTGQGIIHDIIGIVWLPQQILHSKNFIATIHDIASLLLSDDLLMGDFSYSVKEKLWIRATRKGLLQKINNANTIITVSRKTKQQLVDICGIDKEKIFPVNHGVSQSLHHLQTKRTKFVVGTLSGMSPRKNPRFLLNAFKIFDEMLTERERKNVELRIYGGVSIHTKHMINDYMNGYDNFNILGPISQGKKNQMYNSFGVFAFPSIDEGFGMPVLEAQACGVPVIIDGNGMISEEVAEKCIKAYSSEEMADIFYKLYRKGYNKSRQRAAIAHAKRFTWEKTAEETLKVYRKVLE